jgi:hypothetical protein
VSFDAAVSNATLHHLDDGEAVLRQLAACTCITCSICGLTGGDVIGRTVT